MTHCEALHTAARRYCQERIAYWHQQYANLECPGGAAGWTYSDRHKDVFPRYNVLDGILVEVERLQPASFDDLPTFRNKLWCLGQSAQGHCTEGVTDAIQQSAMQEERDRFSTYVDELKAAELDLVEPLPFQRVLDDEESRRLSERLGERYAMKPYIYSYPLPGETPVSTHTFEAEAFRKHLPPPRLQQLLASAGVQRLWELREYGEQYEIDLALLEPGYNGAEGYWTSEGMGWLLYASHEGTLTVSGAWLTARVQEAWATWREHEIRGESAG